MKYEVLSSFQSPCLLVTRSPVHPFTRSPVHPFTPSPLHPFAPSPCHLVTLSPLSPCHPFTRSPCHLVTLSPCHRVKIHRVSERLHDPADGTQLGSHIQTATDRQRGQYGLV